MAISGVGAIIAALIGGGASIAGGRMQQSALGEAAAESRKLGEQERADTLAQNRATMAFNRDTLAQQGALSREQMALTDRLQTAQASQQKARDMAARQGERYDRAISIVNGNMNLKNRLRSLLGGKI